MCGEVDVDFEVETHAIASLATLSWAGAELRRLPEFSMSEIAWSIRAVDCAKGGVTGAKNLSRAPAICNSDLGSDSAS
jgi:hypothetical protein